MQYIKQKAFGFTLVELVVVATILAILSAVGFVAYTGYISGARDSNRLAQLENIRSGLQSYAIKGSLPLPTDYVTVNDGSETLGYQGYAGENVLDSIGLQKGGKDPKDDTYFSYYLSKSRNNFQLLGFLEEQSDTALSSFANTSYAIDYSARYPVVTGESLGILVGTGSDMNIPIQELDEIVTTNNGVLDIATTSTEYTAIIKDDYSVSGDNNQLSVISSLANSGGKIGANCKDLLDSNSGLRGKDGTYLLSPDGENYIEVDCDMTIDGGGWTRYTSNTPSTSYDRLELGSNYISEVDELFFAYKRSHTGDDWYAYKFKEFHFTNCSTSVGDSSSIRSAMNKYVEQITYANLGECARSGSTGDITIEKIISGKYLDDVCINGNLNAHNRATYFGSMTTPDGRDIGRFQNRISNTTVLMGTNGSAKSRCAGSVQGSKANSETYVYIR